MAYSYSIDDPAKNSKRAAAFALVVLIHVLFVWVLWGPGELAPHEDAINKELDDMARTAGCVRVQMRSPRNGWGQRPGWTKLETIYEREV